MKIQATHLDPRIQKAFMDYDKERRIRLTQLGCLIVIVLTMAGAALDISRYSTQTWQILSVRLLTSFLAAFIWFLLKLRTTQVYYHLWGIFLPLIPAFGNAWNIANTDGVSSPYWVAFILVIVPTALLLPWTFQENLIVSLATIGLYFWACAYHDPGRLYGDFFMNLFFLITIAVICVIGTYFTSRLRFREFVARWELDDNRRQLEETNRKLVELDQVKSRFFANISHELRTPLTLLLAPLENIRQHPLARADEETGSTLEIMHVNAMRLLKLINDLLDLVKLESGRLPVHREPLDVDPFLSGLLRSVERTALEKHILLERRIPSGLGTLPLDRDKLEKILLNLVFNSIKFTPAGGTVELSASREGPFLRLAVRDTGIGIAEKDLPHIFNRFYQVDDSSHRKTGGTGIGLALVKELAEVQGGSVKAESNPGAGTVIIVRLPVEGFTPETVEAGTAPPPDTASSPSTIQWLADLHHRAEFFPALTQPKDYLVESETPSSRPLPLILVADDEPDMRRFLKSQLSKHFDILEAADGSQALAKARQYAPDLILLDMMMPEKDGLEVCREARQHLPLKGVPIVLLTAWADETTKIRCLEAGADDFLSKPFSFTELHARLHNLLKGRELSRSLTSQNNLLQKTLEKLKETEAQLVQSEKLNALGQMSAGLIHEINNPLNYALSAIHLLKNLRDRLPENDQGIYQERLNDVEEGLRRVTLLISDLKSFTHRSSQILQNISLAQSVRMALRFQSHQIAKLNPLLTVEVTENLGAHANQNQMIQVLVNLLSNALEAMRNKPYESGEKPSLGIVGRREKGRVLLSVSDNGTGIPEEIRSRIFDPFFTTKEVGGGMGLGLSICYRLVECMGGNISFESTTGRSSVFTISLPETMDAPVPMNFSSSMHK